jgi:hypothetical protein
MSLLFRPNVTEDLKNPNGWKSWVGMAHRVVRRRSELCISNGNFIFGPRMLEEQLPNRSDVEDFLAASFRADDDGLLRVRTRKNSRGRIRLAFASSSGPRSPTA